MRFVSSRPPPTPMFVLSSLKPHRALPFFETIRQRALDYLSLIKPRPMILAVFVSGVAFLIASQGKTDFTLLAHTLLATLCMGGGANALNQYMEREEDVRMRRTQARPLPAERILPFEALIFGWGITSWGFLEFLIYVNVLAALLGLSAFLIYTFIYTPLKKISSLCLGVGAIPGAMPPLMGWAGARSELDPMAWFLFSFVFLWQLPHVLTIWWYHREDYRRGGFTRLIDETAQDRFLAVLIFALTMLVVAVSLLPFFLGWTEPLYLFGCLAGGLVFLRYSFLLSRKPPHAFARKFILGSVLYLPLVLGLFLIG